MDSFTVEPAGAQPGLGENPTHKITITHGSDKYVFWYLKSDPGLRDFDKVRDTELVKLMHAKGVELTVGPFQSFTSRGSDYHLTRLGRHEFTIKILKSKQ